MWMILKLRVKLQHSASPHELRKDIEEVWKKITLEEIYECILGLKKHHNRHMHRRFQICVKSMDIRPVTECGRSGLGRNQSPLLLL